MSVRILTGDCLAVLPTLDAESVDAVITDPPYDLTDCHTGGRAIPGKFGQRTEEQKAIRRETRQRGGFMAMKWDGTGVAFDPATWEAVKRVMKPGAHLIAFGGSRTFHRLTCAIEDAGFEIRDCLSWLYGSGFPKSLDFAAIPGKQPREVRPEFVGTQFAEGWGTAIKPGWEPIILARKPFRGTVAANVAAHGTGALNIAACRIGATSEDVAIQRARTGGVMGADDGRSIYGAGRRLPAGNDLGRWPSNCLLSHVPPDEHGNGGCREVGTRRVKAGVWNAVPKSSTPGSNGKTMGKGWRNDPGETPEFIDADGMETVTVWECIKPWTERRVSVGLSGISLDVAAASPDALLAFLAMAARDLRGESRSWDTSRGLPNGSAYAERGSGWPDSPGGCPSCRRSGDERFRSVEAHAQASPRQLADALESVLAWALESRRTRLSRSDDLRSNWDDALRCGNPIRTAANKTAEASCPSEHGDGIACRTLDTVSLGSPHVVQRDSTPANNMPVSDDSSAATHDHISCIEREIRRVGFACLRLLASLNLLHCDYRIISHAGCPVRMLDEQSGDLQSGSWNGHRNKPKKVNVYGDWTSTDEKGTVGDTGGASRFFYCAKADRAQRNKGIHGMPEHTPHPDEPNGRAWDIPGSHSTARANHHPTVKPIDLMQWLVRLVTPKGGVVLDPFAGSGTTLIAADREGFDAIGIEREAEYIAILEARCKGDAPMFADVKVETDPAAAADEPRAETLPLFATLEREEKTA